MIPSILAAILLFNTYQVQSFKSEISAYNQCRAKCHDHPNQGYDKTKKEMCLELCEEILPEIVEALRE